MLKKLLLTKMVLLALTLVVIVSSVESDFLKIFSVGAGGTFLIVLSILFFVVYKKERKDSKYNYR